MIWRIIWYYTDTIQITHALNLNPDSIINHLHIIRGTYDITYHTSLFCDQAPPTSPTQSPTPKPDSQGDR